MLNKRNIFFNKKILIYGSGKSGISAYQFLKKKNKVYIYDDNKNIQNQNILSIYKKVIKTEFDYIIISPGIDIDKCRLSKFLKKNLKKINTDLDVFFSFYNKNKNITITGTNGKSTTAKILYEILRNQKIDVRLVGNIGNPILSEKNIKKQTVFVIEASSYQLEYSKIFSSNIAAILNISTDHLERHKTLKNYISSKFKIIRNQTKKDYAILNMNNLYIKNKVKNQKFFSKIIKINKQIKYAVLKKINNDYFLTDGNKENLSFVLEIAKILKVEEKKIFEVLNKFNGLQFRQQIIYKSKSLTIINDSKSTSFSSSVSVLKSMSNVFWIVGGLAKKGDQFLLKKNYCKTFKVYIFGKDRKFFINKLKNKIKYESFLNLESLLIKIFKDVKKNKNLGHQNILFSPAAASFDSFKNFEERGKYFNNLIRKFRNVK